MNREREASNRPENGRFRDWHSALPRGYGGHLNRVSKPVSKSKCQNRLQGVEF